MRKAEPCPHRAPGCLKTKLTQINHQGLERWVWWALEHSWKASWRGWEWFLKVLKQWGHYIC